MTEGFAKPYQGALTPLFAAAHPRVSEERDKYAAAYLVPFGEIQELRGNAKLPGLGKELWRISEELVSPYRI